MKNLIFGLGWLISILYSGLPRTVEEEQIFTDVNVCQNDSGHILNYACVSRGLCIRRRFVCDGVEFCLNGGDEVKYDRVKHANSTQGFRCPLKSGDGVCFLPRRYVCDGFGHCKNNIDECDCDSSDYFKCGEGKCVHNSKVCDGVKDCFNGADEPEVTSEMIFNDKGLIISPDGKNGLRCETNHNTTCLLPNIYVDDGVIHCKGGLDECFNDTFFRCSHEQCVRTELVCNGKNDCDNGADEIRSNIALEKDGFMEVDNSGDLLCKSKDGSYTCWLPSNMRCDGIPHCQGNVDECHGCSENITTFYQKCGETNQCILQDDICTQRRNCDHAVDTRISPASSKNVLGTPFNDQFHCAATKNRKNICTIDQRHICDGVGHCFYNNDECNCPNTKYSFNCGDGECVEMKRFCDFKGQCSNNRDELKFSHQSNGFRCLRYTTRTSYTVCDLPMEYVCDGETQCRDDTDEKMCNELIKLDNKNFKCLDERRVISTDELCDGIIHCLDLSDECEICGHPIEICSKICETDNEDMSNKTCISKDSVCNGSSNDSFCPERHMNPYFELYGKVVDQDLLCCNDLPGCINLGTVNKKYCAEKFYQCQKTKKTRTKNIQAPLYAIKGDCIITCELADDECEDVMEESGCIEKSWGKMRTFCQLATRRILINNVTLGSPGIDICNGKTTGRMDETYCKNISWRFPCINNDYNPINVHESRVCDLVGDCLDNSDEGKCGDEKHFYCSSIEDNVVEFVKRSKVCDGRVDCSNGLDECQSCTSSPFSDDDRLISSIFLRVIVWISALFAICGNLFAICESCYGLYKGHTKMKTITKASKMELVSLSTADFLVGIYLFSVAIADVSFDKYCTVDRWWRASWCCNLMGTIGFLGSQASVFTMVMITLSRYHSFKYPFRTHKIRFVFMRITVVWILAFILSVIPLVPGTKDYFVSRVTYNNTRFWPNVTRQENSDFINKLALKFNTNLQKRVFERQNSTMYPVEEHSWKTIFKVMETIQIIPRYQYGYYSAHGVCISNIYPDRNVDKAWGFTAFVMTLNFLIFVTIAAAYIQIYRFNALHAHKVTVKNVYENRISRLQKRVTTIIITDFVCWVPICATCFAKLAGASIPEVMFAITAIVILPINSALNPIIYSSIPEKFVDFIYRPIQAKFTHREQQQQIENRRSESVMTLQSTLTNNISRKTTLQTISKLCSVTEDTPSASSPTRELSSTDNL